MNRCQGQDLPQAHSALQGQFLARPPWQKATEHGPAQPAAPRRPKGASLGFSPPRAGTPRADKAPSRRFTSARRCGAPAFPPAPPTAAPMEEKKGRGSERRGPPRRRPPRPGAHLPQREEVVAPPAEAEPQQLLPQRLREG